MLKDKFQQYGEVKSVKLIMDRETGRPRGFAFVEMPEEDARTAIAELNGKNFEGKTLTVSEAREREERGPRTGGRSGGSGSFGSRNGGSNFKPRSRF